MIARKRGREGKRGRERVFKEKFFISKTFHFWNKFLIKISHCHLCFS